jgi:hypothetical protein
MLDRRNDFPPYHGGFYGRFLPCRESVGAIGSNSRSTRPTRTPIAVLEAAVAIYPNNSYGQRNLGACLLAMKELERGTACLMRAAELNPKDQQAFLGLAEAYRMAANSQASLNLFFCDPRAAGPVSRWSLVSWTPLAGSRASICFRETADGIIAVGEYRGNFVRERPVQGSPNFGDALGERGRWIPSAVRKSSYLPEIYLTWNDRA